MFRHADQNRVHEPAFTRRGEAIAMEQKDQVSKGRLPHQIEDIVSADSDVMWTSIDDRGAPRLHSRIWIITSRITRVESFTVTAP